MHIHSNIIMHIEFFQKRTKKFIAAISPLLKPLHYIEDEYIIVEGDLPYSIMFVYKGVIGYVLKEY